MVFIFFQNVKVAYFTSLFNSLYVFWICNSSYQSKQSFNPLDLRYFQTQKNTLWLGFISNLMFLFYLYA